MSWKFGGIYLKSSFGGDPAAALNRLGIRKRFSYERAPFSETVVHFFKPTAVGLIGDVTLVHDRSVAYDHSFYADTYTAADHRLLVLSRDIECAVFYLDGTTESYGLAHFRSGRRVGHFSQLAGSLRVQEVDFEAEEGPTEARLLAWLEEFTSLSFDELLSDEAPLMYLFTETGF